MDYVNLSFEGLNILSYHCIFKVLSTLADPNFSASHETSRK